jgi:hypothetical protein
VITVGRHTGAWAGPLCPKCGSPLAGVVLRAKARPDVPEHDVLRSDCCRTLLHRVLVHQIANDRRTRFTTVRFTRHALGGDRANPHLEFLSITVQAAIPPEGVPA